MQRVDEEIKGPTDVVGVLRHPAALLMLAGAT